MSTKKIIAFVMAFTFISGGICGANTFNTDTVSAIDTVSDDIRVSEEADSEDINSNVTFGLTDAVVQPGETTYLDIDISENSGFCVIFLKLIFDENVFTLESLSALPGFTGKEYSFNYNIKNHKLIFMNDCHDNMMQTDSSIIRVALKVNEDAPEGDYTIGMEKGDDEGIVAMKPNSLDLYFPDISFTPGTVTVNKELDPKTNVSSMSLGRVYAQMNSEMVLNKTGDLTNDGSINVLDVQRLSQYLLGTRDTAKNGDTNEDGTINAVDYLKLKSYIIGG